MNDSTATLIDQIEGLVASRRFEDAVRLLAQTRDDIGFLLVERTGRNKRKLGALARLFHLAKDYRLVAECFEAVAEWGKAGQMYERAGDPQNAAEMYWRAKTFDRAATCYEASGAFTRAGELWERLEQPLKAGMAFEKSGDLFNAGRNMLAASRPDRAVPLLQKVAEDDFNYLPACELAARGLRLANLPSLGLRRLDGALSGRSVDEETAPLLLEKATIHEVLDQPDEARKALEAVASWNMAFGEVSARLSAATPEPPPQATLAPSDDFLDARTRAGIDVLQSHPLLADFSLNDLRRLYDAFERRRIAAGSVLIEAGEPGGNLFVLVRGSVHVDAVSDGEPHRLTTLGPGAWVGEMSLLDELPSSARVTADGGVAALVLDRSTFNHLLATDQGMAVRFYKHFAVELAQRLRSANQRG
jgi:tetratricopeptide (TPR) repeat protein